MVKELWSKHTGIREVCGLEIILDSGGGFQAYLCSLKLENNVVSVIHQSELLDIASTLKKIKSNKIPLAINFSGEMLVNRVVNSQGSAVDLAFPGIDKDKFYIQEFSQKNYVVVSLINRKAVDSILNNFKNQVILNISVGGIVASILKIQTDTVAQECVFGSHLLTYDSGIEVVNYQFDKDKRKDTVVRFQGIKVKGEYLNAFAQAFQLFFYPELNPIGLGSYKRELAIFFKARKVKFSYAIVLFLTFTVLLANFLLWNAWSNEKATIENQMVFERGMVENRDSLIHHITIKEQQIKNFGILPLSHKELFCEIGKAVPSGIKLVFIKNNPEKGNTGNYGQILIKGELQTVNAYEQFKKNLSRFKIVEESLSYNPNKNMSFFEIRVSLY